ITHAEPSATGNVQSLGVELLEPVVRRLRRVGYPGRGRLQHLAIVGGYRPAIRIEDAKGVGVRRVVAILDQLLGKGEFGSVRSYRDTLQERRGFVIYMVEIERLVVEVIDDDDRYQLHDNCDHCYQHNAYRQRSRKTWSIAKIAAVHFGALSM